jgi:hypothetical protein
MLVFVVLSIVLLLLLNMGATPPVESYETGTHQTLNQLGAQIVENNDPNDIYTEVYLDPHVQRLGQGGIDEDASTGVTGFCGGGRYMNHFYQPASGLGLPSTLGPGRCTDAVTWARNSDNDLTWTGAIDIYDYTAASKLDAYLRVGHVAHLIGDMAQPDHTHLEPHPPEAFQTRYEPWVVANWATVAPNITNLAPFQRNQMETFLTDMAELTYDSSSFFGGALYDASGNNLPVVPTRPFPQMFILEWRSGWFTLDQWQLYNRNADGSQGTNLGNWDNNYGSDDNFWETSAETGSGASGYYYVEEIVDAVPTVYAPRTGEVIANTSNRPLGYFYATKLLPHAVRYIAGLYQHYYDIVNHPPYVYSVKVTQAGNCIYESHWEDQEGNNRVTGRTLEDDCSTPEEERWINAEDGDVQIEIEFGPTIGDEVEPIKDVEVKIAGQVIQGQLNEQEAKWTGSFTPPSDGSMDGEQAVEITASDKHNHFQGRSNPGDQLDSDPASPARAGSGEPYNWQGYETGPDENHKVKIDTQKPEIRIRYRTIGSRCEPQYEVRAEVQDQGSGDGRSGLKSVNASPGGSYDPASDPQTVQIGTVGVGDSLEYSVEAEDKAGNKEEKSGDQPGPSRPPGCDHSDDNYSAASPQGQVGTVVPLDDEPTRVAVLSNGFAPDSSGFVNALREPNILVEPDFSPDIVEEYPLLIIPTGGLYGLENSTFFRATLEEYANRGGTIVVFDQQHGSEYSVLPGGGLDGYGWAEDNSCTLSSLYIRNYDQVVSGFSDAILDSNVDGYFTDLPDGSDVLLHRSKNGQPAMVRYNYGSGTVIATTAYDDWGVTNWQTTADAYVLNRDLFAWAVDPALLPEFDPGDPIALSVAVTNNSSQDAASVKLTLLAPGKQIIHEETQTLALNAGLSSSVTYNTSAAAPLGIWRVDYTLLAADGSVIQERQPGERYVVKDPHPLSAPIKTVALTVNAPTEDFISGTDGEFTFTVFNNSSVSKTLEVRYGLPHHTWETNDAATYGNFSNLSRFVTVGPNSQAQFIHVFPMRTNDRLFAYLYEGGSLRDQTWFQTRKATASATVNVAAGQEEYTPGQTVALSATVTNLASLSVNFDLDLRVTAPDGTEIYSDTRPVSLSGGAAETENYTFPLPLTAPNGTFRVRADLYQGSARISGGIGGFVVPKSPADFAITMPDSLPATAGDPLVVVAGNPHDYLSASGTLALTATGPDGSTVTLAAQPYNLNAGDSTTLNYDLTGLTAAFGQYQFDFTAQDEFGIASWTQTADASLALSFDFDQRSYRIRETLGLSVTVENDGDFGVTSNITLEIPDLAFSDLQSVSLGAGETAVLPYSLVLPDTLTSGAHDVTVSAELGTSISQTQPFFVPLPRVNAGLSTFNFNAGETLVVDLTNEGGVDAQVTGTVKLIDPYGFVLGPHVIDTTVQAGQTDPFSVTIPAGAPSGEYQLVLDGELTNTGGPITLYERVTVSGVTADLSVQTGQPSYFSDEPLQAQASMSVTTGSLDDGDLNLRICSPSDPFNIEGPGTGGTIVRQTYDAVSTALNWVDISTTGTIVAQGDDVYTPVNLGFPFEFYGTTYSQAYVSSNGFITFGSPNTSFSNSGIPNSSAPNNAIYALWDDLYPVGGVYGNIRTQQVDATTFVVEWDNVSHCCTTGAPETFQAILDGSDNSITLQYLDVTATSGATVGVENADGSVATQIAFNQTGIIVDGAAFSLTAVEETVTLPVANYKSYLYTVGDVIFFSYADNSDLALYQTNGTLIWQGSLNTGDRQLVSVPTGTYLATGSKKYAILGGDPVSGGVTGYYAADQNGFGVSRDLYIWNQYPYLYPSELFIVFSYEDNTQVTVEDADTGTIYFSGVLNDGEHWESTQVYNRWLHVTADNPVSAYSYYDQGSLVPASDGRWSGTLFYTYAGLVGNWTNDVNVMAFEDDTQITIENLDTGQVYWTGTVDSGQIHTEPFGAGTVYGAQFLSISSDKPIAVTVAPFVSFTGSYHMGFYAPDSTGSRIGTDIIAPTLSGGTLQVFAYQNDTVVDVYNSQTDQLITSYTLQAGESINANPGYGLWRLRTNRPVSAWAGWGEASAEYAPVLFGDVVTSAPFDDNCGYVIWETTVPVSATTTLDVDELVEPLDVTGRLVLDGRLFAETGQFLAHDNYPFYLFDRDTALTLETDKALYAPGETIQVSGNVTNTSALTANMTLDVSSGSTSLLTQSLSLAPNQGYAYSLTLSATTSLSLTATAANAETGLLVPVAAPQISAELIVPDVVGQDPFQASLVISNTGRVPVNLNAAITGAASDTMTLPPGGVTYLNGSLNITADTNVQATISGDVSQSLSELVLFGEAADLTITPDAVYPAGPVEAPYQIANTGVLPAAFEAGLTLRDEGGQTVTTLTLAADLPVGETLPGTVKLGSLSPGDYTLDYAGFYGSGTVSFTVAAVEDATVTAVAANVGGPTIPLTATVTNTGLAPFNGQLLLQSSFYADSAPVVDLAPGDSVDIVLPVNTAGALTGDHPVQLDLLNATGDLIDQTNVTVSVAAPDLVLTTLPDNLTLPVSTTVTMSFGVRNEGGAAGNGLLGLTFSDIVDEEQAVWLAPDEEGEVSFTFFMPPEMEAKQYPIKYHFNGQPGILLVTVEGIDIDVTPSLDAGGYYEGDTAVLTLHIEELANQATPPLYALVRFNDYSEIQPFNLTPSGSADVAFAVPVSFLGDAKVFYGIYHLASDRSIHLNTIYLPQLHPDVTILTDKQVYLPGETVVATVVTTATGQLDIVAPGYANTITLPGSDTSISFTLPNSMARGSYSIDAVPRNCGCVNEDQTLRTPFDVAAAEVRVTDARLDKAQYEPAQTIQLDLVVASDQPVPATLQTWIEQPDGSLTAGPEQTVNLAASPANLLTAQLTLNSDQAGMHNLIYRLVDPNDDSLTLGQGAETFDVGRAVVTAVRTDKTDYAADNEPVEATVGLFATVPLNANLSLAVDGVEVYNQNVSLAGGFEDMVVTLPGGYDRGKHTLTATLVEGGLASERETGFDYATSGPDLIAQLPALEGMNGSTADIVAIIGNRGDQSAPASTAVLYDGDPANGGTAIATFAVPGLGSGASHEVIIPWEAVGRAGSNLLVLVADANAVVDETDETNNETANSVVIGSVSHVLSSDKTDYYRSETAVFTADLENLSGTTSLTNLTLETAVYDNNSLLLFSDSRALADLAPGASRQETVNWQIAPDVNAFEMTFEVQQQVLVNGAAQPLQELSADIVPVVVTITTLPEIDGHYIIYNQSPTVNMTASDTADIVYQWDSDPYEAYNEPFTAGEGLRTLRAYPLHNGIAVGPIVESFVMVDTVAPQSVITLDPPVPNGDNGWYNTDVTINLSATDQGIGVYQTQTSLDNINWTVSADSFTFGREGEFNVFVRSIDLAGNIETAHSISFKIDKSGPTLVHNGPYTICTGETIILDGTASFDVPAGLSSTNWDLDGDGTYDDGDPASFTWPGGTDPYTVSLAGVDLAGNTATTSTTVSLGGSPTALELYPIALHADSLSGVNPGDAVTDIFNGTGQGNFGWLSWNGDNGVPSLVESLTPPGNSYLYVNPNDPSDTELSVGDWVTGRPGVANANDIKTILGILSEVDDFNLTIPVWDMATGSGSGSSYHIVNFAVVHLTDYYLPNQNQISVEFLGYATCGSQSAFFGSNNEDNGAIAVFGPWLQTLAAILPKGIALLGGWY